MNTRKMKFQDLDTKRTYTLRDAVITFKLSKGERARIEETAKNNNMNMSQFIRHKLNLKKK